MYDMQIAATTTGEHEGDFRRFSRRVQLIAEAGYSGIELAAVELATEAGIAGVRAACYEHQIAPVSALAALEASEGGWSALEESLLTLVHTLDSLGAEFLVLSPGLLQSSEGVAYGTPAAPLEMLHRVAQACADTGIRATYRPHPRNLLADDAHLARLAEEIPAELLGLAPHFAGPSGQSAHESATTFLQRWGGRVNYLSFASVTDAPAFCWQALSAVLDEIGFSGWAVVQEPWNGPPGYYAAHLAAARETLRATIG